MLRIRVWAAAIVAAAAMVLTACGREPVSPSGSDGSPSLPEAQPTQAGTASGASASTVNILRGATLYVDPASNAASTAATWQSSRPADAAQMDKIARQPQAKWFGNWNNDIASAVGDAVGAARSAASVPVLVAYNIPYRDCGGLSGGNTTSASDYQQWIANFAAGIAGRPALVVLEPDALAGMDCLNASDQQTRLSLLQYAVRALTASASTSVYLDGGNPNWQPASTMAARLESAGIASAAGFFLNVSNFYFDADNVHFGNALSTLLGGKHYIIDSSRNGLGPAAGDPWCNPEGRALGRVPTVDTGEPLVDAFLWIKAPGESDGSCNGAPAAGTWMPEYALGLAQRAAY